MSKRRGLNISRLLLQRVLVTPNYDIGLYERIRYDTYRLRAPNNWILSSLIYRMEPKTKKNNEKIFKNKNRAAQKKRPGQEAVQAVMDKEESQSWEIFVKQVGFCRDWKSEAFMDGESSESTKREDAIGAGKESEIWDRETGVRLTKRRR